jgi:transcriptional regulator with XRE-family HTH domain
MVNLTPDECRAAREQRGWTQSRLATVAGLAERTVRLFEMQAVSPRPGALIALCKALKAADPYDPAQRSRP